MTRRLVYATRGSSLSAPTVASAFSPGLWPQFSRTAIPISRWTDARQSGAPAIMPVDVYTTDDHAVVRAALPGVHPDDIEVSVFRNSVTISASLGAMSQEEGSVTWLVSEIGHGTYKRTIQLPFQIEESAVEAQFANGLLYLNLPKVEAEKPHRIEIQMLGYQAPELGAGNEEDASFAAD